MEIQTVNGAYKKSNSVNGTLPKNGKRILGIDFAPINVPWERRLQTIGVLAWVATFLSGLIGPCLLLFCIFALEIYLFPALYIAWIFYDRNTCNQGGRAKRFVRSWRVWSFYRDYFPITLVKTADLDPNRNYLFAAHPHGILCNGVFGCFATNALNVEEVFPGHSTHLLTLEVSFWMPIFRELVLSGGLCTASRKSLNHLLSHPEGGKVAVLVPGGASESLDAHPGSYVIQIKKRTGFIRIALQNGSPVVPVFSFGETDIYDQVSNPEGSLLRKIQNYLMSTLTFAPILVIGRGIFQYSFGLMPNRKPITVVVGAPIEVTKVQDPSKEGIAELQEKYIAAVKDLFYKHRDSYLDSKVELIVK